MLLQIYFLSRQVHCVDLSGSKPDPEDWYTVLCMDQKMIIEIAFREGFNFKGCSGKPAQYGGTPSINQL